LIVKRRGRGWMGPVGDFLWFDVKTYKQNAVPKPGEALRDHAAQMRVPLCEIPLKSTGLPFHSICGLSFMPNGKCMRSFLVQGRLPP
jgi:hypothetical protein